MTTATATKQTTKTVKVNGETCSISAQGKELVITNGVEKLYINWQLAKQGEIEIAFVSKGWSKLNKKAVVDELLSQIKPVKTSTVITDKDIWKFLENCKIKYSDFSNPRYSVRTKNKITTTYKQAFRTEADLQYWLEQSWSSRTVYSVAFIGVNAVGLLDYQVTETQPECQVFVSKRQAFEFLKQNTDLVVL